MLRFVTGVECLREMQHQIKKIFPGRRFNRRVLACKLPQPMLPKPPRRCGI
jgi:hypothetical protein